MVHYNSAVKHGSYAMLCKEEYAKWDAHTMSFIDQYRQGTISYEKYTTMINYEDEKLDNALVSLRPMDDGFNYKRAHRERRAARNQPIQHVVVYGDELALDYPNQNIRAFVDDKQNVHTTIVVKQTTDVVNKIREIPVPEEFRWNKDMCSKTPADIILRCGLTPDATFQMMSKYCSSETIYEMDEGVYGKTLDSVWQFILKSDDKECLIKTLKQEMEDNIGMCAQGNLSRLCNILAGYLDGVGAVETPQEVLARRLPPLMEIENVDDRLEKARNVLREVGIPNEKWDDWLIGLK